MDRHRIDASVLAGVKRMQKIRIGRYGYGIFCRFGREQTKVNGEWDQWSASERREADGAQERKQHHARHSGVRLKLLLPIGTGEDRNSGRRCWCSAPRVNLPFRNVNHAPKSR